MISHSKPSRSYRRLVPACRERDIGRTTAFELARTGLLETFKIGAGTYVYIDSLDSLPERIAAPEKEAA